LTTGGLPLGFGGGAPLKNADREPSTPPVVLRGFCPLLLVDVLPGGLPRFEELRLDVVVRLVFANWRVPFFPLSLLFWALVFSVIFGIIAQMVLFTSSGHISAK